jgi:two-component system response regulator RegA
VIDGREAPSHPLTFVKPRTGLRRYDDSRIKDNAVRPGWRVEGQLTVNGSNGNGKGNARSMLVVHEQAVSDTLVPALVARGFAVDVAHTATGALAAAARRSPHYAVVALKLPDESGLRLIAALLEQDPATRIVVVTAYPSIETAVEAIKLGAVHYLVKPVSADRVIAALLRDGGDPDIPLHDRPMSVHRVEWEYIHHMLLENNGNISATARALAIHRRTLQRKLRKHPAAS